MEAAQHVRLGVVWALAGCALGAAALGITWPADILIGSAMTGGSAEWNDIDHHGSTVTRSFPPLTFPLYRTVVWINRILYMLTRRGNDPPAWNGYARTSPLRKRLASHLPHSLRFLVGVKRNWRSAHRGFTHFIITAILVGVFVAYVCTIGPWWVSVILFVTTVGLAGELVFSGPIFVIYILSGLVHFGINGFTDHIHSMAPLWGGCVFFGMLSHDFGDTCTTAGLAFLGPFTWEEFHSPFPFHTGSFFEVVIVKWILIFLMCYFGWILALQWLPVVFPHGIPFLQDLWNNLVRSFSSSRT